jgi:hypothetical protein
MKFAQMKPSEDHSWVGGLKTVEMDGHQGIYPSSHWIPFTEKLLLQSVHHNSPVVFAQPKLIALWQYLDRAQHIEPTK